MLLACASGDPSNHRLQLQNFSRSTITPSSTVLTRARQNPTKSTDTLTKKAGHLHTFRSSICQQRNADAATIHLGIESTAAAGRDQSATAVRLTSLCLLALLAEIKEPLPCTQLHCDHWRRWQRSKSHYHSFSYLRWGCLQCHYHPAASTGAAGHCYVQSCTSKGSAGIRPSHTTRPIMKPKHQTCCTVAGP